MISIRSEGRTYTGRILHNTGRILYDGQIDEVLNSEKLTSVIRRGSSL